MDHLFTSGKIEGDAKPHDLLTRVAAGLMTPEMQAAGAAGCRFEITATQDEKGITITLRTVEKVSILKMPDGTPVSVLIKR